jgi:3-hydroxyisobutyrate dehydrogenase-like beta-hydroxyacid dehydrogenase
VLDAMGDQAAYIGPIGAGTIAKLVHNCTSAVLGVALAEVFTMGIKAGPSRSICGRRCARGRPAANAPLTGSAGFCRASTTRPTLHCGSCTRMSGPRSGSGASFGVAMRLANMAFEELTEAMNRGWGTRNSTVGQLLQVERSGIEPPAVDPDRVQAVIDADKE